MKESEAKKEFIYWCRLLNQKGLVSARSGNVSCKVGDNKLLVSAHDCYLGHLEEVSVLRCDLQGEVIGPKQELTSEKDLHLEIHRAFPEAAVVLHAHPPHTTAFFHYFDSLDIFSFEAKFYLGAVPVLEQETPTVTDIAAVLKALKVSTIVVLKNHGVVAIGKDFKEAFSLIELLEEQAKVNLLIRASEIRNQKTENRLQSTEERGKEGRGTNSKRCAMLSQEHRERLTEVVNNDSQAQELGKKYDLTCTLAVKNQDTGECMRFCYEKGKIVAIDSSEKAEFVIIGSTDILRQVFNRKIDPFVASTQGKVKTKGDFAKMSRWYPVMVRTFKLWEQAPVV